MILIAAVTLLAGAGGVAWALGVTKAKPYSGASSYTLALERSADPTVAVSRDVQLLKMGDAILSASCTVGTSPDTNGVGVFFWYGITNTGTNPILVAYSGERDDYTGDQYMWLAPGQSDPVFGAGQLAAGDIGDHGGATPFSILDEDGTSVTGIAGVAGRADDSADIGHCVFSAQARG